MNQPTFNPTNELEEVLVRAASQPSARPEFYQKLLDSQLWLLTPEVPLASGETVIKTGTQIQFVNWQGANGVFLAIFSSEQQLKKAISQTRTIYGVLALKGSDLFPILAQHPMDVVLNPGALYGKNFVPDEIRRLGDGSIVKSESRVVQKPTKILLGQPAVYPHAFVKALQELFSQESAVEAAYLAQMHDPSSGDPPHLIIGIQCNMDYQRIFKSAGITSQGLLGDGKFADFIQVGDGKGSLDSYFQKQTKPFYQSAAKKSF